MNRYRRVTHRILPIIVALAASLVWGHASADGLGKIRRTDRYSLTTPVESAPIVAESGSHTVRELTSSERDLAERLMLQSGDGGGGAVEDLLLVQTGFVNGACECSEARPCNIVLMLWTETSFEAGGINIFVNDTLLGNLPGVPFGQTPATNGVNITGVAAGENTFRIESVSNATSDEAVIDVLDDLPFSEPAPTCESGAADGEGTCQMNVTLNNEGEVLPSFYFVSLDGTFLGSVNGAAESFALDMVPTGEHCAQIQGVTEVAEGIFYQGCEFEACCTIECADVACNAPFNLLLCQDAYGEEFGGIRAAWQNGQEDYEGVGVELDGELLGVIPGDSVFATFGAGIGEHTVSVIGSCGKVDGLSEPATGAISLLTETPHPNPIDGAVTQTFDPKTGVTTASWTNADPSDFIDVLIAVGPDLFFLGSIAGESESIGINGTDGTETIVLQFFVVSEEGCYGSDLVNLPDPPPGVGPFTRGNSNADLVLDISDAQYSLDFLFLGGPAPVCLASADTNGDGTVDVSDPTYGLTFLFLGGPAPPAPFPICATSELASDIALGCETPTCEI